MLTGSLTCDPELHLLPSGNSVCNLRVACSSVDQSISKARVKSKTDYFDVKVYGAQALTVEHRVHKEVPVVIEGTLDWREWETIDGHQTQTVSIVANEVQALEETQS